MGTAGVPGLGCRVRVRVRVAGQRRCNRRRDAGTRAPPLPQARFGRQRRLAPAPRRRAGALLSSSSRAERAKGKRAAPSKPLRLRSSGWPQGPHGPLRTGPRDLWQVRAGLTPTLTRTRALTGTLTFCHAGVQLLEEDLAKVGGQQTVGLARGRGGVRVRVGLGFRLGVRVAAKARARARVQG